MLKFIINVLIWMLKNKDIVSINILILHQNYTAVFEEPFTIPCTVEDDKDTFVNYGFWIKNIGGKNVTLYNGHPGTKGINRQDPTITIISPTFNDSGIYTCGVNWRPKHHSGTESYSLSQPASLVVIGEKPFLEIAPRYRDVELGIKFVIECNATSMPEISESWWMKNGFNLTNVKSDTRSENISIVIPMADFNDTGNYTCCAANAVGVSCSNNVTVNVKGESNPDEECFHGTCVANAYCDAGTCVCINGYLKTPPNSPTSCTISGSVQVRIVKILLLVSAVVSAIVPYLY